MRVRSLVGELRSICLEAKTQSRSNILADSIKTFKMVHIKKKKVFFKKRKKLRLKKA